MVLLACLHVQAPLVPLGVFVVLRVVGRVFCDAFGFACANEISIVQWVLGLVL